MLAPRLTILERRWLQFYQLADVFKQLLRIGAYTHVDLDIIDGQFEPSPRGWTSGPDEFELPTLFEISQFESAEIARKGKELERLLDAYV